MALGLLLFALPAPCSTVSRIADEFAYAPKNVFRWKTAAIFGSGLLATAASTTLDRTAFENFTYRNPGLWVELGNFWGTPFPAVGLFTVSLVLPEPKLRRFGESLFAATLSASIVTGILKYAIGRTRPSGTNNLSLPSGHTTFAFATAAVIEQHFGWKVGVPAYALAVMTGAARVADGAHWVSDTVLGATIGIGVAELFRHTDGENVQAVPYPLTDPQTGATEGYGLRVYVTL